MKTKLERTMKHLGRLASSIAESTDSDSVVLMLNKDGKTACVVGGRSDNEDDKMVEQFRACAMSLTKMADSVESGDAKLSGGLYEINTDGTIKEHGNPEGRGFAGGI